MAQGTLYIISAPSGAGKSSLIQSLLKTQLLYNIEVSISYTTRASRPGEYHGKHYFFVSKDEFYYLIKKNEFLEYAKVFGHYYGTARAKIKKLLSSGIDVFLDIDWQGAQQIKKIMPQSCSIFILPPSKEELYRRLYNRGKDSKEIIVKRMTEAVVEMTHYIEYDYLIINHTFDLALLDLKSIIFSLRLRSKNQFLRHKDLIKNLLSN
ncbi:Guanylate kinase [Candidatus Ecksteinia adelgidicola]|nr:Guanylate kinase [Candidatus Ecksteinia adelgidicola]